MKITLSASACGEKKKCVKLSRATRFTGESSQYHALSRWLSTSLYPKVSISFTYHTSRSGVVAMRERCVKTICRSWSRALFSTRSPRTVLTRSVRRVTQISLANVKLPAPVACFRKHATLGVRRDQKSSLDPDSVHHRSPGPSLCPEVTWFIKVNREEANHRLNQSS